MQRRAFLQAGVLGAFSATSAAAILPSLTKHRRGGPLKLSSNENPLGLSPKARQAVIDGIEVANRYPHALHHETVDALAQHHQLSAGQIVLGAGSSEVLQMAVQAFAQQKATFVIADPTFEDVQGYAAPWGLKLVRVPLRKDHAHDLGRMREAVTAAGGPAVVYVCNPNNPTGTLTPVKELDAWIEAADEQVTFLVDEAYFEFAEGMPGFGSVVRWTSKRRNVVVTRTFSKIHAMAGLRVGYGLAHVDTAARLRDLQSHNDCNALGLLAAKASLADQDFVKQSLACNAEARAVVEGVLKELGLGFLPSCANFVMHEIKGDLHQYIGRMREQGIMVGRPFPPMLGHNRVSLGTAEEMTRFADTLRTFRKQGQV